MLGVEAYKDGTPAGSVQNMSYAYDSLSNLKNRHDHFTGVNETFSYDGLNRLLSYIEVGGSVGTYTVETKYDARGNIAYKSDVGQFWYDAARPNRMTNVTLSAPAGAAPLTGTRALSYAFDDYLPTAQSANGTTLGNGNLMYTVSHNAATNKHTVRWESYTSFNMIHEIKYANIGAGTGGSSSTATTSATMTLGCGAGQTLVAGNCVQNTTVNVAPVVTYAPCAAGSPVGSNCVTTNTQASTTNYICQPNRPLRYIDVLAWASSPGFYWSCEQPGSGIGAAQQCALDTQNGYAYGGENSASSTPYFVCAYKPTTTYQSCPVGFAQTSTTTCTQTITTPATAIYSCPVGNLVGTGAAAVCNIPAGTAVPAGTIYSCPSGYQLSGTQCQNLTNTATSASSGATSDRTDTFTYGPEHQRIKQVTALSGNGTSSYSAGTTWYLNGTDGQSLTYEKVILTTGVTEHKHYLQAAGITFAQYTQRTGTGVTATSTGSAAAQALRYFHHDHLGSIAVITKETGTAANNSSNIVVERLAFDPWGKRRFPNGLPDLNDSIVGVNTDRGYTEHEHLDEMGVIHMNGRVYDPLVGRFMSADPFVQNPFDLRSFNRYSYVWNNPLNRTDPAGFECYGYCENGTPTVVVTATCGLFCQATLWLPAPSPNWFGSTGPNFPIIYTPTSFYTPGAGVATLPGRPPIIGLGQTNQGQKDVILRFLRGVKQVVESVLDTGKELASKAKRYLEEETFVGKISSALNVMMSEELQGSTEPNTLAPPDAETGNDQDPADKKGELTKAGRAQQKHGDRGGAFEPAKGTPDDKNHQGKKTLDSIVNSPDREDVASPRGGTDVFESSKGRGARFDRNGRFDGFLEPRRR